MKQRLLGATGLSVSILGFGASPLGGVFGNVDAAEGVRAVQYAVDNGVNFFDVAPFYGLTKAETALGNALKGIPRDHYYLATKVGRYGERDFDFSPARVTASVDESLKRLGMDYVDIIQCHDIEYVSQNQIVEETLPALRKIVQAGKARFVGITGLPLEIFPQIINRVEPGIVDTVISYCHYTLSDTSLDTLLPYLQSKRTGVINAAALGMGLLQNRAPLAAWHPAPRLLREKCAAAAALCAAQGADIADLALSFSLSHPQIATTLVGMGTADEVRRNLAAAETVPDPLLLAQVREILQPVRDVSWPSGV